MFDNGTLWLISRDEYRGSAGVKNKQGGFFKGKWFHFNTPNFHEKGEQEGDNQHFICFSDPGSPWRGEKQVAGDTDVTIWRRPRWTPPLENPQKVSFMMAALRDEGMLGGWGGFFEGTLGRFWGRFHVDFLIQKHTRSKGWCQKERKNADRASVSKWLHLFFSLSARNAAMCQSPSRTWSSGQVWFFSPIYFFFSFPYSFKETHLRCLNKRLYLGKPRRSLNLFF